MRTKPALVKSIREQLLIGAELRLGLAELEAEKLAQAVKAVAAALRRGKKILLFGNGGSAADAQHLAAELVNRMVKNRRALAAIALTTDTSILTSIANDHDFDRVFARQIEALGQKGDIAWGFSTSGSSANVLEGFKTAKKRGLFRLGFAGRPGSPMDRNTDLCLHVDAQATPRIQELHITLGHILCEEVEEVLFGQSKK
jgi:D-sedoheptulose 7-phosphate isomerase